MPPDPTKSMELLTSPGQRQRIEFSHVRCRDLGMDARRAPDFSSQSAGQWRLVLERSESLRRLAVPVMTLLHRQIARARSMVILTDSAGCILETVGDAQFLQQAEKVALSAGIDWSEAGKGTNAIGTALIDKLPTLVHGEQHFLQANHFLTCSAVPLWGPDGSIAGVLDVTGHQSSYLRHTMALIDLSATIIGNGLVVEAPGALVCLSFHARPDLLSTPAQALVCFDAHGRLVASNVVARRDYGLVPLPDDRRRVADFLDLSFDRLVDHGRRGSVDPLRLHLTPDRAVFARVSQIDRKPAQTSRASHADQRVVRQMPPQVAHGLASKAARETPPEVPLEEPVDASHGARTPGAHTPGARTPADALGDWDLGDPAVRLVIARLRRIADTPVPILLVGATGTGKQTLARAMHASSTWRSLPFRVLHCASLADDGPSLFEQALPIPPAQSMPDPGARRSGTVLLDGIDEMPPPWQVRLLSLLANGPTVCGWRLVCTSRQALTDRSPSGHLRADLYYRLNGLCLHLPSLCDRTDRDALIDRVLGQLVIDRAHLSLGVRQLLLASQWPGNLHQMRQLLRTAAVLAGSGQSIGLAHLADDFRGLATMGLRPNPPIPAYADASGQLLRQITDVTIREMLVRHRGNVSRCARELGVSRNTVYRCLRRKSLVD